MERHSRLRTKTCKYIRAQMKSMLWARLVPSRAEAHSHSMLFICALIYLHVFVLSLECRSIFLANSYLSSFFQDSSEALSLLNSLSWCPSHPRAFWCPCFVFLQLPCASLDLPTLCLSPQALSSSNMGKISYIFLLNPVPSWESGK